ncbi:MAG: DUF11 domain-containing protein [Burkholderiaceae bacterium]|nr:DUF11 domain-containing protein [Burkholderiaceae bacterium]
MNWLEPVVRTVGSPGHLLRLMLGNTKWVGNLATTPLGIHWYRYEFNLDSSIDPDTFSLSIKLSADDHIYHVFVNGKDHLSLPPGGFLNSYNITPTTITLDKNWQPGLNQIFVVTDNITGPSGLLAQLSGAPLCSGKLSVSKTTTQNTAVAANAAIPFEVIVANTGTDDLPAGATLNDPQLAGLSSGGTWACSSNINDAPLGCPTPSSGSLPLNASLGPLPAGGAVRFSILATTDTDLSSTPRIENTATLTLPQGVDPAVCLNAAGKSSCTASAPVSTQGYLSINKRAKSPGPFLPGDTVTYFITLTNEGSVDITDAKVYDTVLPAGLIDGTWTCQAPVMHSARSIASCPNDSDDMPLNQTVDLPAHSRLVYTVTATVDKTASGTLTNTAKADAGNGVCWNGPAVQPTQTCSSSASVVVASTVPVLDRLGYWLTGFGVLALAAVVTVRRGRAIVN